MLDFLSLYFPVLMWGSPSAKKGIMMLFDQDQAMLELLKRLKTIFSDSKAMDSAVYRSGIMIHPVEGAIALTTGEILGLWQKDGALNLTAIEKSGVLIKTEEGPLKTTLFHLLSEKGLSLRQTVCLTAAIYEAYQVLSKRKKQETERWQSILDQCSDSLSSIESIAKLRVYCEEQLGILSYEVEELLLNWVRKITDPIFSEDNPDTLSEEIVDYFMETSSLSSQTDHQTIDISTDDGNVILFDILKQSANTLFVFGEIDSPFYGLSLSEKRILDKPFDTLSLQSKPIAQVGRIVSYEVCFESHLFVVHHSGVSVEKLTVEEKAYLYQKHEESVEHSEVIFQVGEVGPLFETKPEGSFEVRSPAPLVLYYAAIEYALEQLSNLGEASIEDSISTLAVVLGMLKKNNMARVGKLQTCEFVSPELKTPQQDALPSLLTYLIERMNADELRSSRYLMSTLVSPLLLTTNEAITLHEQMIKSIGEDDYVKLSPLFLEHVIQHYTLYLASEDSVDVEDDYKNRLENAMRRFTSSCNQFIEATILAGSLDDAKDIAAEVYRVLSHYPTLYDDIELAHQDDGSRKESLIDGNALFCLYHEALSLHDNVESNDFIGLMRLEQKLIKQLDDKDHDSESDLLLTEFEKALLLKYEEHFEALERIPANSPGEKQTALSVQMKEARSVFLSQASNAKDQEVIQALNDKLLISQLEREKRSQIKSFIDATTRKLPVAFPAAAPKKKGKSKKVLLIKGEEFIPEHIELLRELIETAHQKGTEEIRFMSTKSVKSLIQQQHLSDTLQLTYYVNEDIETAQLDAQSTLLPDEFLMIECEANQNPVHALLVMFYYFGAFNNAVAFFNGEVSEIDLQSLPGFKQYGFQHSPLLGLYRPSWLSGRIGSVVKPELLNSPEEDRFFENQIKPYLLDGILKRSYEKLDVLYQYYVRYVFYQEYKSTLLSANATNKETFIQAILGSILEEVADYKSRISELDTYDAQIKESAMSDYAYYHSSTEALSDSVEQQRYRAHLSAISEDLLHPITNELKILHCSLIDILSTHSVNDELLSTFDTHLERAEVLCKAYALHIETDRVRQPLAYLNFVRPLRKYIVLGELWPRLGQVAWHTLDKSVLKGIGEALHTCLLSSETDSEQKQFFSFSMNLLKKRMTESGQGFFEEGLTIYAFLKKQIKSVQAREDRQFYCSLLFDFVQEATLFSQNSAGVQHFIEEGYFPSETEYNQWVEKEKNELIVMMNQMLIEHPNADLSTPFYDNLLTLLANGSYDVALREQACDHFCRMMISSKSEREDELLMEMLLRHFDSKKMPGLFMKKMVLALHEYTSAFQDAIQFPSVLSELHWRTKSDSLSSNIRHAYYLLEQCADICERYGLYLSDVGDKPDTVIERLACRKPFYLTLHDYFDRQMTGIQAVLGKSLREEDIAALSKRLMILEELAQLVGAHEGVSFQRLKSMHIKRILADRVPADVLKKHGVLKQVQPELTSENGLNAYLLRKHDGFTVISPSLEHSTETLSAMYFFLVSEGNKICNLNVTEEKIPSLPALFQHIVDMTSESSLNQFVLSDIASLYKFKQFLRKLYHFSFEEKANDIMKPTADEECLDGALIKTHLDLIEKYHAKLFLMGLKTHIEKKARNQDWHVGIQKTAAFVTIEGKQYRVPRRIGMQYQHILQAFPEDGCDDRLIDYVDIEKTVILMGEKQVNQHTFWSSKPSRTYWRDFSIMNGSLSDVELQVTDALELTKLEIP